MKKLIYEAYCNEIANDKYGKTLVKTTRKYSNFFYFKNYKILNLNNKNYLIFFICSMIYIYVWLVSIFYFTIQFFISGFIFKKNMGKLKNVAFIDGDKSLYDIGLIKNKNLHYVKKDFFDISAYLSLYEKYSAYKNTIKVVFFIYKSKKKISKIEYNSLKLHIYDLYIISIYYEFIKSKKINFFINSHYERWGYIASKIKNIDLNVIQHGFLANEINFPFKFGNINTLYIYDNKFIGLFQKYYSNIESIKYIKPNIKLVDVRHDDKYITVFIASSMLSVDMEKSIIEWLLSKYQYRIYIKLHPSYNYQDKFAQLEGGVNFIDYFPKVDIMMCYNSFLGYEYKALGEKVIWMQEYEDNLEQLYLELEKYVWHNRI